MRTANTGTRRDLNARGLKATPQRLAVMDAVNQAEGYFTPQKLYENLKSKHSEIGLVTVYRTLAALKHTGLICQMESSGKASIYVRRSPAHHHHLVCDCCSKVMEFNNCELKTLIDKLTRETGFTVRSHSLELQGLCPDCSRARKESLALHKI